jgi:hypothetical protein
MRLLIAVGNCLVMLGGWFECLSMYRMDRHWVSCMVCVLRCSDQSKVTSKKFATFKFTSAVIFRSNWLHKIFEQFDLKITTDFLLYSTNYTRLKKTYKT